MSNPPITDRRFDKSALDSLVDLINFSNKTYIKYGEIEVAEIRPLVVEAGALYNTVAVVRLAGAGDSEPTVPLGYGRLDIGEYLPEPVTFNYSGLADAVTLFDQLRSLHHIQLDGNDCAVIIGELEESGFRHITFRPKDDHLVWVGELTVQAGPSPNPQSS